MGTKSVTFTVTVPESVKPTVSNVAVSEAVSSVTSAFGNRYVKNTFKAECRSYCGRHLRKYNKLIFNISRWSYISRPELSVKCPEHSGNTSAENHRYRQQRKDGGADKEYYGSGLLSAYNNRYDIYTV